MSKSCCYEGMTCEVCEPKRRPGTQYVGTLPEGYEWRFVEFHHLNKGSQLKLLGCHPKEGMKMYRLDGLTLVEEEIKFEPMPPKHELKANMSEWKCSKVHPNLSVQPDSEWHNSK